MVPNGITHQVVTDDTEGVGAILDWLCLWLQIRHIDFTRWSQRKTDGQTDRQTDRQREREIWMCTNPGVCRKSPLDGRQFGDDIILGKINTSGSPFLVLYTSGHSKFKLR